MTTEQDEFLISSSEEDDEKNEKTENKYDKRKIEFTITVCGSNQCIELNPDVLVFNKQKQIVLNIYKESGECFRLVCFLSPFFPVDCGTYETYEEAIKKLNSVMKLAMKRQLVYKDCWHCDERTWYGMFKNRCAYCGIKLYENWIVNL